MIWIIFILMILASTSEAIMDKLQFHYSKSIFSKLNERFWNPEISHANKWKDGDKLKGERFFLSSTVFVFLTDAWHLFKWLRNNFVFTAFAIFHYNAVNSFLEAFFTALALRILYSFIFEQSFKTILDNGKEK